jgi:hypothetical protein
LPAKGDGRNAFQRSSEELEAMIYSVANIVNSCTRRCVPLPYDACKSGARPTGRMG